VKVFVTGPTGHVAGAVTNVLPREGQHVVGLAHDEEAKSIPASRRAAPIGLRSREADTDGCA
jgi:uncharacterized protein YbjT (DUF2867 family)